MLVSFFQLKNKQTKSPKSDAFVFASIIHSLIFISRLDPLCWYHSDLSSATSTAASQILTGTKNMVHLVINCRFIIQIILRIDWLYMSPSILWDQWMQLYWCLMFNKLLDLISIACIPQCFFVFFFSKKKAIQIKCIIHYDKRFFFLIFGLSMVHKILSCIIFNELRCYHFTFWISSLF